MRIGIMGTGAVSEALGADVGLVEGATVHAVASRDLGRARGLASRLDAPQAYDDVAELLDDRQVDLVYIATPTSTHGDLAVAALEAGKHVLVEKPLASSAADARRIADARSGTGLFAMEAMWMKFSPGYHAVRTCLEAGRIGTPRSVRASFGIPADTPAGRPSTILDQGVYAVTLAQDVLGTPRRVRASGTTVGSVEATVFAQLEFEHGSVAQIASSHVEYVDPSASISGTGGWITIAAPFWTPMQLRVHAGADALESLFEPEERTFSLSGNGYAPMIDAAISAIRAGSTEHPAHLLSDSISVLATLDEIRTQLSAGAAPDGYSRA